MLEHRATSTKRARDAGHNFPNDKPNFSIMCDFPPRFVHPEVWRDLCKGWNTNEWKKKSERGRNNRMSVDDEDVISRHTGGSRDTTNTGSSWKRDWANHRHLRNFFLQPTLSKSRRKSFGMDYMMKAWTWQVFCTNRSRKAYEEYATAMLEKYEEDVTQHPVGDIELWERTQGGSKFGIGSSDSNFIITG